MFGKQKLQFNIAYQHTARTTLATFGLVVLVCAYVISFGLFAGPVQPVEAAIPKYINFQGKLTAVSNGNNVANGSYSFEFKLYDAPSGGSLLWTETWDGSPIQCPQLAVAQGVFNAKLGACEPLTTVDFTGGALYLTVNFNPGAGFDGEMSPRKQLVSSAYSFVANSVSGDGVVNNAIQSATALSTGRTLANPALQVDTNTASSVTGLKVTSAAAGGGLALATISSGTDENLTIDAKGAGTISIGSSSTGNILLGGGSASTGCTVTNSTGAFACTSAISSGVAGGTIGGYNLSGNTSGTISILPQAAAGTYNFNLPTTAGTSGYVLTSAGGGASPMTWTDPSGLGVRWNAIINPTGTQTLTFDDGELNAWTVSSDTETFQTITANSLTTGTLISASSSSLTSGSLVSLSSTSTAAASNTQKVLNVTTSGANATSTQTTYGGYFSNTHTGTSSTNVAGYFTASGGTNNYAIIVPTGGGNVGIGTSTPANLSGAYFGANQLNPLWVSANDAAKVTAVVIQGNLGEAIQFVDQSGTAEADFGVYTTDIYFVNRQASGNIRFDTNGSTSMFVGSNQNVGIGSGTSAPAARLEVKGTSGQRSTLIGDAGFGTNYAALSVQGTLSTTAYSLLGDGTNLFVNRPTGGDILFRENNGDHMTIKSGGNVGIGTTGPDRKLDILDNASNPQLRLTFTDGSVYTDLQTTSSGYLSINPSAGRVGIGTLSPDRGLQVYGTGVNGDIRLGRTDGSANIYFGSGTESLGYGGSNTFSLSGANTFTQTGSSNTNFTISQTGSSLNLAAASGAGSFSDFASANDSILRANNGSLILTARNASGNILFGTGASDTAKMAILSGGNVGIGDTSPGSVLDLDLADANNNTAEQILFRSQNTVQGLSSGTTITNWRANQFLAPTLNGILGGGTETVTNASTLYVDAAPSGSNITITNPYALWVDSGVSRFDGNVGIGTTAAAALLSVGSGAASNFMVNGDGDITAAFTALNGSSTANGAGTNSTTLIVNSGTNFDVGNYVKVDPTGSNTCSGSITVCYAKITAKATNTLTISPALTWDNGAAVDEMHIPELGGINTSEPLTNRYGRGYFIDGIVTGNGSTYFSDNRINVTNGNFAITGGNVGIGDTSPAALFTVGSGDLLQINSSGLVLAPNGSASNPAFSFVAAPTSGMFYTAGILGSPNMVSTAVDGTEFLRIQNDNVIEMPQSQAYFVMQSGDICIGRSSICPTTSPGGNGTVYSNSLDTGNVDVAENYPSKDSSLQAGELVMIDADFAEYIERSDLSMSGKVIGVISTDPGLLLGGIMQDSQYGSDKKYPVALVGRVPVKVTNENGAIEPGDFLTASATIPGAAMRATKAGSVIGQALEGYSVGNNSTVSVGSIITFIKPTDFNGISIEDQLAGLEFDYADIAQTDQTSEQILEFLLAQLPSLDYDNLSQVNTDILIAGAEVVSPNVTTQTLRTDFLSSATSDGGLSVASTTMFNGGLTVDTISAIGDLLSFSSDVEFFGTPYFTSDTAGFAVVKAGVQSVDVVFTREYLAQPIVNASISFEQDVNQDLLDEEAREVLKNDSIAAAQTFLAEGVTYVVTNKSKFGFTIVLSKPAPSDVKMSWTALAVRNATTFMSIDTPSGFVAGAGDSDLGSGDSGSGDGGTPPASDPPADAPSGDAPPSGDTPSGDGGGEGSGTTP